MSKLRITGVGLLTTEHSASSYGIPVLIRRGEAYGPGDLIGLPDDLITARELVRQKAKEVGLEDHELVKRF